MEESTTPNWAALREEATSIYPEDGVSSNILDVAWHEDSATLFVDYANKKTGCSRYAYPNVEGKTVAALKQAFAHGESIGSTVHRLVKSAYPTYHAYELNQ